MLGKFGKHIFAKGIFGKVILANSFLHIPFRQNYQDGNFGNGNFGNGNFGKFIICTVLLTLEIGLHSGLLNKANGKKEGCLREILSRNGCVGRAL